MITALERNKYLQPYLAPQQPFSMPTTEACSVGLNPVKALEAIYLDTACMLVTSDLPSKKAAVQDIITLLSMYPPKTKFFINSWTWGYEDILIGIARAFGTQVSHCYGPFCSLRKLIVLQDPRG
jgi:DNA cross-link repair 1C protein